MIFYTEFTFASTLLLPESKFGTASRADIKSVPKTKAVAMGHKTEDTMDLTDFIMFELLRLHKIEPTLLEEIVDVFTEMDTTHSGITLISKCLKYYYWHLVFLKICL